MGNRTVAKDTPAWFGSHEYVGRDEKDACENVAKSKIKIKLAIPERNNASAATEHRKFRRGLYLARGVQSNGRHNNTWTPVVNFGRSAGVSYTRVRPLLVFSSVPPTAGPRTEGPVSSSIHVPITSETAVPLSDPFWVRRARPLFRAPSGFAFSSALIEHKCTPNRLNVRIISITETEFPLRKRDRPLNYGDRVSK